MARSRSWAVGCGSRAGWPRGREGSVAAIWLLGAFLLPFFLMVSNNYPASQSSYELRPIRGGIAKDMTPKRSTRALVSPSVGDCRGRGSWSHFSRFTGRTKPGMESSGVQLHIPRRLGLVRCMSTMRVGRCHAFSGAGVISRCCLAD
jgi:hypothetical protein